MAKNGHALIFVALKRANFTEVETIFDGMLNFTKCHRPVYGRNVYGKNACIWVFASRRVFTTPETHLPKIPLERITIFLFFGVLSPWSAFYI